MAVMDVSGISYFLPLLTFLVVFLVAYAVAKKTEFFDSEGLKLFVAFLIAIIFISAAGPRAYVESIVPWFVVLLISFFLIVAMLAFVGFNGWHSGLGKAFAIIAIVVFVISGIFVFSSYFSPYLPWNSGAGANPDVLHITDWFFSPRVFGAILLLIVTAIISFVIFYKAKAK